MVFFRIEQFFSVNKLLRAIQGAIGKEQPCEHPRILVIDDEQIIVDSAARILTEE